MYDDDPEKTYRVVVFSRLGLDKQVGMVYNYMAGNKTKVAKHMLSGG